MKMRWVTNDLSARIKTTKPSKEKVQDSRQTKHSDRVYDLGQRTENNLSIYNSQSSILLPSFGRSVINEELRIIDQ
jgi:hypothetical protein